MTLPPASNDRAAIGPSKTDETGGGVSMLRNERIAVLAGGPSCEREVSLVSGKNVFEALSSQGLTVIFLDATGDFMNKLKKQKITLAFIALHGTFGEDGTVQRFLEEAGIGYTGSSPAASENAFHKSRSQRIFREAGILVPEFYVLARKDFRAAVSCTIPFPVVVKPSAAGSSVGVSIVSSPSDFHGACEEALRYSEEILVERYIRGREFTVGILDGKPLPIVEILAKRSFYDYEAKYKDSGTSYECPASLGRVESCALAETALAAHRALGCEAMSRSDFIWGEDRKGYLLEVNTIPGLTGKSLLPKAARAAGIDFSALCVRILELSLKKRLVPWSNR